MISLSWIKPLKRLIEAATVLQFVIAGSVFMVSLILMLWAIIPNLSIKAASYMFYSFLLCGTSLMGFIGCYLENFCLLMGYGSVTLVNFAFRITLVLVLLKLKSNSFLAANHLDETITTVAPSSLANSAQQALSLPPIMSGLPGTSSVGIELAYSCIDIVLVFSAFCLAGAIEKRNRLAHEDAKYHHFSNNFVLDEDFVYSTPV